MVKKRDEREVNEKEGTIKLRLKRHSFKGREGGRWGNRLVVIQGHNVVPYKLPK